MSKIRFNVPVLLVATLLVFTVMIAGCGPQKEEGPATGGKTIKISKKAASQTQMPERPTPSTAPITETRIYYDFESDLNGWEVPMWAQGKRDHIAKSAEVSTEVASHGKGSMKIEADFPGGMWSAALVEIQQYLDMSNYRVIRADVYLPPDAPMGLNAKLIITVGETWKFVEMSRSYPLIPGEWVTINASIEPGSYDWKRVVPDEKFAEDVRKIAVRIESNKKPKYTGSVFVDNIRVGR
ncbi:MAG: hypothetical protein GF409_04095 [Candidatus Omnitrophica bacterium]|nr:hypothetical protein [Candidatus Omnitrophota bacterium]